MLTMIACESCGNVDSPMMSGSSTQCTRCTKGYWHGAWEEEKFDPNYHRDISNRQCNTDPEDLDDASFS